MLNNNNMLQKSLIMGAATSLLLLAACATSAPYAPQQVRGGAGYTDQQLAANRYRVTFTGNASTSRAMVEDALLRRAAEVTLQAGYNNFMFDTRNTEAQTDYYTNFSPRWPGYGPAYGFGPSVWYWHSWTGDPWLDGRFGPTRLDADTRYQAYAEIIMLNGAQAGNEPKAMDARDVLNRLGPAPTR